MSLIDFHKQCIFVFQLNKSMSTEAYKYVNFFLPLSVFFQVFYFSKYENAFHISYCHTVWYLLFLFITY